MGSRHAITGGAGWTLPAVAAGVTRGGDGALATFIGLVRAGMRGRDVLWLEYEAYAPLALKAFAQDRG
jgi:molybdopterin synthase catalytic subunit